MNEHQKDMAKAKEEMAKVLPYWKNEFQEITNGLLREPLELRLLFADMLRQLAIYINDMADLVGK